MTESEGNVLSEVTESQKKKEKEKARKLRQTQWWQNKLNAGVCHYCGKKYERSLLTMDHIVPLSRGGKSTKGNVTVSCKECNNQKKDYTPVDAILKDKLDAKVTF